MTRRVRRASTRSASSRSGRSARATCSCSRPAPRPAPATSSRWRAASSSGCPDGRSGRSSGARTCSRTTRCSTASGRGGRPSSALFPYYLGWLGGGVAEHFTPPTDAETAPARGWGMRVAVEDLRRVVRAARRGGRTVVLGGHSLGGTITTAYASWDFGGRAGARDLAGLVFIDGGSSRVALDAAQARDELAALQTGSPFNDLVGLGLPWAAGVFAAAGSTLALEAPGERSTFQDWPLAPAALKPPVPVTNAAQFGYAIDTQTGPAEPRARPGAPRRTRTRRRPARMERRRRPRVAAARRARRLGHRPRRRLRVVPPEAALAGRGRGRRRRRESGAAGPRRPRDPPRRSCRSTRTRRRSARAACSPPPVRSRAAATSAA